MSSEGPVPPPPASLLPLAVHLEPGTPIFRVHHGRFGAAGFNPGLGRGRFHPLEDRRGRTVPTLYGSDSLDGALSETVFHHVPVRGAGRAVRRSALRPLVLSVLAPRRRLTLVQLHGHGLRRLGVRREELIGTEAAQYPRTVRWAAALHAAGPWFAGLEWVSRQHDTSLAFLLFGDRVGERDLELLEKPSPLGWGRGFEEVQRAAEAAGILIVEG